MKHALLAVLLFIGSPLCSIAQDGDAVGLAALFTQLQQADDSNWQALERAVQARLSHSGSASMDLLLERGRQALEEDDLETANDHFSALTDHAPDFAEGWHMRATTHFRSGRMGIALDDLSRALAIEPRHFDALEGVAVILEELGKPERALAAYHQVLAIHPQNADVKEAVARLKSVLGTNI